MLDFQLFLKIWNYATIEAIYQRSSFRESMLPHSSWAWDALNHMKHLRYSFDPSTHLSVQSWSGSHVQGLLLTEHVPVSHSEEFELFNKDNREP